MERQFMLLMTIINKILFEVETSIHYEQPSRIATSGWKMQYI